MQPNHLIPISEFCIYYQVEIAFVQALEQQGLVETIAVNESVYVESDQLVQLEKLVRLHKELSIHPDDLDVVVNLLERLEGLQHQIGQLQNRLIFYERLIR